MIWSFLLPWVANILISYKIELGTWKEIYFFKTIKQKWQCSYIYKKIYICVLHIYHICKMVVIKIIEEIVLLHYNPLPLLTINENILGKLWWICFLHPHFVLHSLVILVFTWPSLPTWLRVIKSMGLGFWQS